MNNKQRIMDLFRYVVQPSVLDTEVVASYIRPDYEQCVDGVTLDYEGFLSHMRSQKAVIASMDVEFLGLGAEGESVFSNHVVTAQKKDGGIIVVKVMAQFDFKDGRVIRCDELTRMLSGAAADRDIGSRR